MTSQPMEHFTSHDVLLKQLEEYSIDHCTLIQSLNLRIILMSRAVECNVIFLYESKNDVASSVMFVFSFTF